MGIFSSEGVLEMVFAFSSILYVFLEAWKRNLGATDPNVEWLQPQNVAIVVALLGYAGVGGWVKLGMFVELCETNGGKTPEDRLALKLGIGYLVVTWLVAVFGPLMVIFNFPLLGVIAYALTWIAAIVLVFSTSITSGKKVSIGGILSGFALLV